MSKVNVIKSVNGYLTDMNNLPISLRGTTAYRGVYFGKSGWDQSVADYIAVVGISQEEREKFGLNTFLFQLSRHSDARDAAYVTHMFDRNREENLQKIMNTGGASGQGAWDYGDIPTWEYPQYDTEKTLEARNKVIIGKVKKEVKKAKLVVSNDDRKADDNFNILCQRYNIPELSAKFGRAAILTARKFLTINEFELRFGLVG